MPSHLIMSLNIIKENIAPDLYFSVSDAPAYVSFPFTTINITIIAEKAQLNSTASKPQPLRLVYRPCELCCYLSAHTGNTSRIYGQVDILLCLSWAMKIIFVVGRTHIKVCTPTLNETFPPPPVYEELQKSLQ